VEEVADLLAVDHKTVRAMIEHGDLPALRVGRVLRIDPTDLARLRVTPRGAPAASGKRERRSSSGEFSRLARLPYRDGDTKSGPAARQRPGPGNGGESDA
jgi:excisionase family DNA binding protein